MTRTFKPHTRALKRCSFQSASYLEVRRALMRTYAIRLVQRVHPSRAGPLHRKSERSEVVCDFGCIAIPINPPPSIPAKIESKTRVTKLPRMLFLACTTHMIPPQARGSQD